MQTTNPTITIGIDPGYALTGYAILETQDNTNTVLDYGVITTTSKQAFTQRLQIMHTELTTLIQKHQPTVAGIEKLFFAKNTKTAIDVAQARGVIILALAGAGLAIHEFTPLQIKQATASYGRADKRQVQLMMQRILKLDELPQPDDAADALAIAWMASNHKTLT